MTDTERKQRRHARSLATECHNVSLMARQALINLDAIIERQEKEIAELKAMGLSVLVRNPFVGGEP